MRRLTVPQPGLLLARQHACALTIRGRISGEGSIFRVLSLWPGCVPHFPVRAACFVTQACIACLAVISAATAAADDGLQATLNAQED